MKEKIVVLNSGGFDSVCLCHWVRDNYPDAELHSLHFEYGNRNRIMETYCAKKVCRKLGMISHNVKIPKITWTRSTLYGRKHSDETGDAQYLEYRNLIFLSYAASLAQSIGSHKIFLAVIRPVEGHGYIDCSGEFFNNLEKVLSDAKISIETPFIDMDKWDFKEIAKRHHVTTNDFFSCNEPDLFGLLPCGRCPDCLAVEEFSEYLNETH